MKITSLEIENLKRVKAVALTPELDGLTVIGGKNGQGKTSVLDAIAWALGGDRFRPDVPERAGSVLPPTIRVEMDNGIIVERKGKNGALRVTDTTGRQSGQQLLNSFIEQLALDLPRFMRASDKDKADTLLKIIGVGDKLYELERHEATLYSERTAIGRIVEQKTGFAAEMPRYEDAPEDIVTATELIRRQQDILAKNAENNRLRGQARQIAEQLDAVKDRIAALQKELITAEDDKARLTRDAETAQKTASALEDEKTDEIERDLMEIDKINTKVRANLDRQHAMEDAQEYRRRYDALTEDIEAVRREKRDLLTGRELPLPELAVENGVLCYKGYPWGNLSGSDQMRVATAIVRKLNPKCGFVLLDKLEQMDGDTMREFGDWLAQEGLQAIATRVSTGAECSVVIEDGMIKSDAESASPAWKEGVF